MRDVKPEVTLLHPLRHPDLRNERPQIVLGQRQGLIREAIDAIRERAHADTGIYLLFCLFNRQGAVESPPENDRGLVKMLRAARSVPVFPVNRYLFAQQTPDPVKLPHGLAVALPFSLLVHIRFAKFLRKVGYGGLIAVKGLRIECFNKCYRFGFQVNKVFVRRCVVAGKEDGTACQPRGRKQHAGNEDEIIFPAINALR